MRIAVFEFFRSCLLHSSGGPPCPKRRPRRRIFAYCFAGAVETAVVAGRFRGLRRGSEAQERHPHECRARRLPWVHRVCGRPRKADQPPTLLRCSQSYPRIGRRRCAAEFTCRARYAQSWQSVEWCPLLCLRASPKSEQFQPAMRGGHLPDRRAHSHRPADT